MRIVSRINEFQHFHLTSEHSKMVELNADVLEIIFQYLDFRSLCAAEMTCKHWKNVINNRRLYWQLSKRLSARSVPRIFGTNTRKRKSDFQSEAINRERRKLRNYLPVKMYGKVRENRNSM